jgi:hypothetical protein
VINNKENSEREDVKNRKRFDFFLKAKEFYALEQSCINSLLQYSKLKT